MRRFLTLSLLIWSSGEYFVLPGSPAAVRLAMEKGSQVGCDVIVDRGIHPIASEIPKSGPLLAYVGSSQPVHTTTTYAPPPNQRRVVVRKRVFMWFME